MRRLGIVGIRGGLERAEMTAYHGGIDIAAACDVAEDRRAMASERGISVFDDYDRMLARANLDSIIIATPNHLHCDMVLKAYARGLDVFIEKPLATTLEDCERMVEASEASGRFMMVGLCYRHANLYNAFADAVRDTVGVPRLVWCKEFRGYWGFSGDQWRLSQSLSGGSLVEKNCHHFDIMNWAVRSRAVRVQAFGGRAVHQDAETIDHAMVNVEYANGAKGVLMLSLFEKHFAQLEIGALSEQGKVETLEMHRQLEETDLLEQVPKIGRVAQDLSVWPLPGVEQRQTVEPTYSPLWPDGRSQHLGSARQFEVLHQCLTQGRRPPVDGRLGIESLLIAFAAEQSIQQGGQTVDAPQSVHAPEYRDDVR